MKSTLKKAPGNLMDDAVTKFIKDNAGAHHVKIYTDGACSGNPGPGGWGAVLLLDALEEDLFGGEPQTTNNRMELMAVISALEALSKPCQISLYTDSKYVQDGITSWMQNWKKNGWMTAAKKPVKNQDLWMRLDAATSPHTIAWHWVKGHAGDEYNERADDLARSAVISQKLRGA